MKPMAAKTKMRMATSLNATIMLLVRSRLADAAHQDDRDEHDDEEGGNVEAEVPAGVVEVVAGEILQAAGEIGGRDPARAGMQAEPVEQVDDMGGEADADAHVGAGVLEDQIPADDPGDELAERGVGVGVGRAGDGNHGGQLGVAEAGERADEGHQHHGEGDGGTGAGTAGERGVGEDVVNQRRVGDGGVRNCSPEMAVPMTVKMPEPMTAPMPSAVSDQGPSVFFSACSGSFESLMSLSIDFRAKNWLGSAGLLAVNSCQRSAGRQESNRPKPRRGEAAAGCSATNGSLFI